MSTIAIISSIILGSIGIGIAAHLLQLKKKHQSAEQVVVEFFDFNKQVSNHYMRLEEQGRNCYRSLDGETMRLMYEAQQIIQHGYELERLGIQALSTRDTSILEEVGRLFDMTGAEEGENLFFNEIRELTPRDYRAHITSLMEKLDDKISKGARNLQILGLANNSL